MAITEEHRAQLEGVRLPPRPAERSGPPIPVGPGTCSLQELGILAASLASSFALVWIVFEELTFLSGPAGFVVSWLVCFLLIYWMVNAEIYDGRVATGPCRRSAVGLGALCMFTPLVLLGIFLFVKGIQLFSVHLFTATQKGVDRVRPLRAMPAAWCGACHRRHWSRSPWPRRSACRRESSLRSTSTRWAGVSPMVFGSS